MRPAVVAACALLLLAPVEPRRPREVKVEGFLHAVQCVGTTARWTGTATGEGPASLYAETLSFQLPDGRVLPFTPKGEVFSGDHSFEVFSPDCAWVLLPSDHYGPYHLVDVGLLPAYLEGKAEPARLGLLHADGAEARVHASPRWLSPTEVQFQAACCGGVEVLAASVTAPGRPRRLFFAPWAPNGVRELDGGFEVVP